MTQTKTFQATVNRQGRITLPSQVRKQMKLEEGTTVEIEIVDDHTLHVHAMVLVDREQAWAWKEPWLSQIRESEANLVAGKSRVYRSDEEFLSSLDED